MEEYEEFPEGAAQFYCANILLALQYVHGLNIIHRDLKPDNLLVDDQGYLVLADFGLAIRTNNGRAYSQCGTRDYMVSSTMKRLLWNLRRFDVTFVRSLIFHDVDVTFVGLLSVFQAPEYQFSTDGVTRAVDYWALGVIVLHMLTNKLPFQGDKEKQLRGEFELPENISTECADFISQLLTVS